MGDAAGVGMSRDQDPTLYERCEAWTWDELALFAMAAGVGLAMYFGKL